MAFHLCNRTRDSPPVCSWTCAFHPCSITEILGLEFRRLEHLAQVLFQNNSHCEKKVLEEKQHVKYPAKYALRRTEGIVTVHKGDRVSPYTLQKSIYTKFNRRKQVKGQEREKQKNSTYNSWWHSRSETSKHIGDTLSKIANFYGQGPCAHEIDPKVPHHGPPPSTIAIPSLKLGEKKAVPQEKKLHLSKDLNWLQLKSN